MSSLGAESNDFELINASISSISIASQPENSLLTRDNLCLFIKDHNRFLIAIETVIKNDSIKLSEYLTNIKIKSKVISEQLKSRDETIKTLTKECHEMKVKLSEQNKEIEKLNLDNHNLRNNDKTELEEKNLLIEEMSKKILNLIEIQANLPKIVETEDTNKKYEKIKKQNEIYIENIKQLNNERDSINLNYEVEKENCKILRAEKVSLLKELRQLKSEKQKLSERLNQRT